MIPGGGKRKGSSFERQIATALSLWVSEGARSDLFARTVLSGGQFTASKIGEGVPGDLMSNHPLAFVFTELFCVEAKHYKDLGLDKYLLDMNGKSFLAKTMNHTREQALAIGVMPLVIAKQNRMPPIVIMDYAIGMIAKINAKAAFRYHTLHNNEVCLVLLEQLLTLVRVKPFLMGVKALKLGVSLAVDIGPTP